MNSTQCGEFLIFQAIRFIRAKPNIWQKSMIFEVILSKAAASFPEKKNVGGSPAAQKAIFAPLDELKGE